MRLNYMLVAAGIALVALAGCHSRSSDERGGGGTFGGIGGGGDADGSVEDGGEGDDSNSSMGTDGGGAGDAAVADGGGDTPDEGPCSAECMAQAGAVCCLECGCTAEVRCDPECATPYLWDCELGCCYDYDAASCEP